MKDKWIILTDAGLMINNQSYDSWSEAADVLIDIYISYKEKYEIKLKLEILSYSEYQKRIENVTI